MNQTQFSIVIIILGIALCLCAGLLAIVLASSDLMILVFEIPLVGVAVITAVLAMHINLLDKIEKSKGDSDAEK